MNDRKTHTHTSIHTAQNTADLLGQNDKCARRRRREDLSGVPVHTRVWALSRGRACGPAARRGFLDFRGNREEVAWRGFLTFCVVLFLNATFLNARNRLYAARIFFRHRSSGRVRITAPPGPGCDVGNCSPSPSAPRDPSADTTLQPERKGRGREARFLGPWGPYHSAVSAVGEAGE